MRAAWLVPLAAALAFGQAPPVAREGGYWVQSIQGTLPAPASGLLRVSAQGPIEARGSADGLIRYSLKGRVQAAAESEARRLLRQFRVTTKSEAGWTWLVVTFPERGAASADLKLQIPRRLRHSMLVTREGAVEAYDLDGAVGIETGAGQVHLDRIKGSVNIRTGGGEVRIGRVGGELRCLSGGGSIHADYAGGKAFLETAGGEIVVQQAAGPVVLSNAGGNIRVVRALSGVTARTTGGLIDILQAGGIARAETGAGCVKVAEAKGAQVETTAGTILLRDIAGPLRVSTVSGSILAELLAGRGLDDSILNGGSGDVTVSIPSNLAVTLQVHRQLSRGGIVSEFPTLRGTAGGIFEGVLNGGGPLLRISTTAGRVYLRRQQ